MRRVRLLFLVIVVVAGVAALPVAAKEGVEATLTTKIPLDAEPGERLKVAWTLRYVEGGQRQPFGANGVFVRLLSASGARTETGFTPTGAYATGEYAATVIVPEGGIGDIEIGLRGTVSDASGTRASDLLFPITNDPLPASIRVASPPATQPVPDPEGDGSTAWILIVVVLASLSAMGAVAVAAARRKRASQT